MDSPQLVEERKTAQVYDETPNVWVAIHDITFCLHPVSHLAPSSDQDQSAN